MYLFLCSVLIRIFGYNTAVTIKNSTFLGSVGPSRELSSLRVSMGTSKFVASSSEMKVVLGIPELGVDVHSEVSLVEDGP